MSFDSNADIIAGVSLGGITLLDPIAIHWEYINEHFFHRYGDNLPYHMDNYHTITYRLDDFAVELHVHAPTGLIYKLSTLPDYRGKFHDAVGIGTPIREVELELEYDDTESGFRFPDHPGILLEPDIPHPWPSAFPHLNVDRITVFNEDYIEKAPSLTRR